MLNFPHLPAEDWWLKVDDTLIKWRTKWTSEVQITKYVISWLHPLLNQLLINITSAFNDVYAKDKQTFGEPFSTELKAVEARQLPKWQQVLHTFSKEVKVIVSKKRKAPTS
jgi:hypothetical protein